MELLFCLFIEYSQLWLHNFSTPSHYPLISRPVPAMGEGMDSDERLTREPTEQNRWSRRHTRPRFGRVLIPILVAAFISLPFLPWGRVKSGLLEVADRMNKPRERIVEVKEPPPPMPDKFVASKAVNVAELSNGIQIVNEIETREGETASLEREAPGSYQVSFKITLTQPSPASTLPELARLNASLPKALPGLAEMMPKSQVSQFYYKLYEEKKRDIAVDITRLEKILTKHNYFDLETILELQHPSTGQKMLLLQSEMDVVSDGSDGDRMPSFDDYIAKSAHFQPTTSYFWKKLTTQPNPLLARYQEKQRSAETKAKTGPAAEQKAAKADAEYYGRYITDLKTKSFLIGQEDPFVVIPLTIRPYIGSHPFAPAIGDYAVVMVGERLFPAIVGDFGPREKTGEASLRIAREISGSSSPYARPVSDLKATYLFFPGSAIKPWTKPDYAEWRKICGQLIERVGGLGGGYELHTWTDRLAPTTPTATK